ncbi:MAG: cytochrome c [Planctomycetales bacterium]|nr:cytochrome c [Planctomycetales bacterium]
MTLIRSPLRGRLALPTVALLAAALSAGGCGKPVATFQANLAYLEVQRRDTGNVADATMQNIAEVVEGLFGTPDDPHLPRLESVDCNEVLDIQLLQMAAGSVSREEVGRPHGLYREHCVHCHGISGDGMGPTAGFLNPYPRDYRAGLYKFKSTPSKLPPAHDDLKRILYDGIPGTAMPSFKLLADDELAALIEYVKYLSIRGQVERALIAEAASELDEGDLFVSAEGGEDNRDLVAEKVSSVVARWKSANDERMAVPERPDYTDEELAESVRRGRELFHGKLAQCSKCHGETALGDGVQNDYDEWTKELKPAAEGFRETFVDNNLALAPRHAIPRNLRMNVFRGGRRPVDIYWRIKIGINGSPMPAASPLLDDEKIWDIVNYVRHLPFEAASEPPQKQPSYQRDRL